MTQVILNFLCQDGVVVRRKWEQFYFYTFGGTCLGKRFSGGLPQLKPASTNVAIIHSLDSSSGPQKCHLPKEKGVFFCVPFTSCLETTDERVLGELEDCRDWEWTSLELLWAPKDTKLCGLSKRREEGGKSHRVSQSISLSRK